MGETHQLSIDLFARFSQPTESSAVVAADGSYFHEPRHSPQAESATPNRQPSEAQVVCSTQGGSGATFWAQPSMGIPPQKIQNAQTIQV